MSAPDTPRAVPHPDVRPAMTVEEAGKLLGISRFAAYEGVRRGEIPSIRIGRRLVVPTVAVRRMLLLDDGPGAA